MKFENQLCIVYKHYIPEKWIEEFKDYKMPITCIRDDDKYSNFSGPELSDIILFIKDNNLDSIFLVPAYYDIVKYGIISLWKKLRELDVKIIKASSSKNKEKKISIRYEDLQGRQVNINMEGNISDDLIEDVVEEAMGIIKSDEKEIFYSQNDMVYSSESRLTIEFNYNTDTRRWEPVNFGNQRKEWEQLKDDMENYFD